MAGFLTDFANNKVLDLFFGASGYSAPTTLYFGLSTATSVKAGTVAEPPGGGYSRVAVTNTLAGFPASSGGTKSNATAITFPAPTGSWGTIASVFVADAASGGNVLAMADLPAARAISAGGNAPTIAVGALYLSHT